LLSRITQFTQDFAETTVETFGVIGRSCASSVACFVGSGEPTVHLEYFTLNEMAQAFEMRGF
jgi:hypothetical protein